MCTMFSQTIEAHGLSDGGIKSWCSTQMHDVFLDASLPFDRSWSSRSPCGIMNFTAKLNSLLSSLQTSVYKLFSEELVFPITTSSTLPASHLATNASFRNVVDKARDLVSDACVSYPH